MFSIKISGLLPRNASITSIKMVAYRRILHYPMHVTELQLDEYLRSKYQLGLKEICLRFVMSSRYSFDGNETIIVTARTEELSKLAQFITFGESNIFGSDILKRAFK